MKIKKKLLILLMFGIFVFLIFPQDILADSYIPIGKFIWFNLSPASNSTLGGVIASVCPSGQLVNGVTENGTLNCAVP